ncbi:myelin P2 protein-like [Amphiura filiformis]|uniref:myelin P2 protein-like n=1 Tax=Amphiura filiformis TaxID=82378 RepID=UPI003B219371
MVDRFCGKYKLEKSENFDEFMKALGVNIALRKIGQVTKPQMTISQEGDQVTFFSESSFKNIKVTFKLGEDFNDTSPDGRKVINNITLDGNKLIQIEKPAAGESGKEVTYVRDIDANGDLVVVCTTEGITCTRLYKKV